MSMPTKGKHHLSHHQHQSHQSLIQSRHIIGLNINQTTSNVSHSTHNQHFNPTILNNTSRFLSHTGSDFHVPGQNFAAQPGGQVGGGGSSVGVPGGRAPPIGGIQTVGQASPGISSGVSSSVQSQSVSGSVIPPQLSTGPSVTTTSIHNPSCQEMGKQTHLQTQPSSMQPVYVSNPSRSTSQPNYYASGPRPQQTRNVSHRGAQATNQSQVVGLTGVGAASGQPTAIYPHPNITMPPSTMFVQGQVSNLHPNPHQQNVYSMNNQMPMQYSGPPQRHQTHQNQFPYQSYQTHALLATSNLFSYTHGAQHPGFFFPQAPSTQINLNRTGANSVNNNTQHVSGPLNNTQGTAIVPQGTLQQQGQQQTMHTLNMPLQQSDIYSPYNSSLTNLSIKSKKLRTKAIKDIVNPNTGKNISAEIYKDDDTILSADSSSRDSPQSQNSSAVVAADFAARVAKRASESMQSPSFMIAENSPADLQVTNENVTNEQIKNTDYSKHDLCKEISSSPKLSTSGSDLEIEKTNLVTTDLQVGEENDYITTNNTSAVSITSTVIENVFNDDNNAIHSHALSENKNVQYESQKQQLATDLATSVVNKRAEIQLSDTCCAEEHADNNVNINPEITTCENEQTLIQTYIEQAQENTNGEMNIINQEVDSPKCDNPDKSLDGKTMQKQKNKNKVKSREVTRRVVEKEGTDMDTFTNPTKIDVPILKDEIKQESAIHKDIEKDSNIELTKNIKEKDNYESRKEKDISESYSQSTDKSFLSSDNKDNMSVAEKEVSIKNKNNKEVVAEQSFDTTTMMEDIADHVNSYRTNIDKELISSIVAQKNEENSKVSGFCITPSDDDSCTNTINLVASTKTKSMPLLKYTYSDDQWSPINTKGKKVYGREFLMKLQNDPHSKQKPLNLPDLDVVLKDNTKNRNPVDLRFKDANLGRHDVLFPGFVKSSLSAKVMPPSKKSHSGKPKVNKPNVIHLSLSLREDVKLRETENAWKPTRLIQSSASDEQTKTDILYKKVRSVLNKLTPQKFETLVNQVRELQIDTQERLQGVINLVFEKAVDEPNFSVAYALMCKELSNIEVTGADSEESCSANFRKLILTRCQTEFEKNTVDENTHVEKLKEIEECKDPEKKRELQMNFEEEERRMRMKSVGNIRFIGELFKQNMLTTKIMKQCIQHLLHQADEENLECLCKLLTTIGKVLESKNIELSEYFKQMQQIANRKGKISSRIRFMLQDVIDLRANKWIPRRDDSNPKTMDQIQKEAESERLDIHISNVSLNTPRKDERLNERKRNRGGTGVTEEGGWSQAVTRTRPYHSIQTSKLQNKPSAVDDMLLGSRSAYQWSKFSPKMMTPNKYAYLDNITPESEQKVPTIHLSGSRSTGSREYNRLEYKSNYDGRNSRNSSYLPSNSSNKDSPGAENLRSQSMSLTTTSKSVLQSTPVTNEPVLSEAELQTALNDFLEQHVSSEEDVKEAVKVFKTVFPDSTHVTFVHETINAILEKSEYHRTKTSKIMSQLLSEKCISLAHFNTGLGKIFEAAMDLLIDIPKLWNYIAKVLVHPIANNSYPLSELKTAMQPVLKELRNNGQTMEFLSELLTQVIELQGKTWVKKNWMQSGLHWSDFAEDVSKVNQIITTYKLEFLTEDKADNESDVGSSVDNIHDKLLTLLKDPNIDDRYNWIKENFGDRVKDPKFIRALMTAILETSVEQCNDKWTFKVENFYKFEKLIQFYVDADDELELQCIFAVQAYINKLRHPPGLLLKIVTYLCENNVLSNEAFLTWERTDFPAERDGKSVAVVSLKSFFTPLKEAEDITSDDDA